MARPGTHAPDSPLPAKLCACDRPMTHETRTNPATGKPVLACAKCGRDVKAVPDAGE